MVASVLGIVAVRERRDRRGRDREPQRAVRLLRRSPSVRRAGALDPTTGSRARGRAAWIVLGACAALALVVPIERLEYNAGFQSVALLPWLPLADSRALLARRARGVPRRGGSLVAAQPARPGRAALARGRGMDGLRRRPRRGRQLRLRRRSTPGRSTPAPPTGSTVPCPTGERVAVVWSQQPGRTEPEGVAYWLMVAEMFNESVGVVHRIGPPTYYESVLPTVPVDVRADSRLALADDSLLDARFVLVTCRAPVIGRVVAASPYDALQLVEATAPRTARGPRSLPRHGFMIRVGDTRRHARSRSRRGGGTRQRRSRPNAPAARRVARVARRRLDDACGRPSRCASRGHGSSRTRFSTPNSRRASRTGAGRRSGACQSSAGARSTRL